MDHGNSGGAPSALAGRSPIGQPAIRCLSCGGLEAFVSPDGLAVCRTCHEPPAGAVSLTAARIGGRLRWQPLSPPTKRGEPNASTHLYVSARLGCLFVPAGCLAADYACPHTGHGYRRADAEWLTWLALRLRSALPSVPDESRVLQRWLRITNAAVGTGQIGFPDFLEISSPKSLNRRVTSGYAPPVDHDSPFQSPAI